MKIDLNLDHEMPRLEHAEAGQRLEAAQRRLTELRLFTAGLLGNSQKGPGIIVLFEGFDAAGKGGAIRRVDEGLDPRHVTVRPIGPPTEIEKNHHFLWRFASSIPGHGEMTIFDRSWYGRVLVERVDELITSDMVKRSFTEINDFERSLVADGTIIVKFWMHISEDEQLTRFEERRDDPLKQWKLTDEDWHNRKKRPHYIEAANEMLALTDIDGAPWHVVFGDHKEYARVFVLETLVSDIEKGLERLDIEPPTATKGDYLG